MAWAPSTRFAIALALVGCTFLAQAVFAAPGRRTQNLQEEPPRLRTIFKNGAVLLVENLPQAKYVSVQLFASDKHLPDTPETHGYRHLLEHLALKGPKRDLDLQMERQGVFFLGRTLRD